MIKKHFMTGIIFLLPLFMTILIFRFFLEFLTNPFIGFVDHGLTLLFSTNHGKWGSLIRPLTQLLILFFLLGATVVIGAFTRWYFFHELLRFSDWIFHRIPLINIVYKASKEVFQTLFHEKEPHATLATIENPLSDFRRVVLVPFPNEKAYCIGLVTSSVGEEMATGQLSVFIPAIPNPMMGFLLLYDKQRVFYLDMTVEEAFKSVLSCGVSLPQRIGKNT